MAKFTIPVEHLPPPNEDGNHVFRFRVVSEDRNRLSQYSTLYTVKSLGQIYPLETTAEAIEDSNLVNIYWETPSVYNTGASAVGASVIHNHQSEWKIHPSDIFVSWDSGEFEYFGRSEDSEIAIIKRAGSSTIRVIGQSANYPPVRSDIFKIFDTGTITFAIM